MGGERGLWGTATASCMSFETLQIYTQYGFIQGTQLIMCILHMYKCIFFSLADVDECSSDTYPCDSQANCTNSIGSFSCNCHVGYSGSGTTCEGKEVYSSCYKCKTFHYKCKVWGWESPMCYC